MHDDNDRERNNHKHYFVLLACLGWKAIGEWSMSNSAIALHLSSVVVKVAFGSGLSETIMESHHDGWLLCFGSIGRAGNTARVDPGPSARFELFNPPGRNIQSNRRLHAVAFLTIACASQPSLNKRISWGEIVQLALPTQAEHDGEKIHFSLALVIAHFFSIAASFFVAFSIVKT